MTRCTLSASERPGSLSGAPPAQHTDPVLEGPSRRTQCLLMTSLLSDESYEPLDINIKFNFRKELLDLLKSETGATKDPNGNNNYVFQSKSINSNATEKFRVAPKVMTKAIQMYEAWKDGALQLH